MHSAELRRKLGKVTSHKLRVVFVYGDICLLRVSSKYVSEIIVSGKTGGSSVGIELLEDSTLIALDLSQYLVQALLLTLPHLFACALVCVVVCLLEGAAICMVEQTC